jgi:hypothetical protein
MINVYITKFNNVIIDSNVAINSGVVNGYVAHFEFQELWTTNGTLQAVFKPVNDIPIHIDLDSNNNCTIPPQIYKRFAKLGVGVRSFNKMNSTVEKATSLFYVPIKYSGEN